jgi:hypothetical protein
LGRAWRRFGTELVLLDGGQDLLDLGRVGAVGGGDRGGRGRHRDGEFLEQRILHDRAQRGGQVRGAVLSGQRCLLFDVRRGELRGQPDRGANAHRLRSADQAGRAQLVGARSADINGVNVVADALLWVLIQPVHRPTGRDADLIALELYGLSGGTGDGSRHRYSRRAGKAGVDNDSPMADPEPDSGQRTPAGYDSRCYTTHQFPPKSTQSPLTI